MKQLSIIGYIGADAKLNETNGNKFLSFNVAIDESYKDKATGEKVNKTDWVSVISENLNLQPYLKKGTQVFAQGSCKAASYTDQNHNLVNYIKLTALKIELLGGSKNQAPGVSENSEPATTQS